MSRIQCSAFRPVFFLLFTVGILLTVLSRPAAADEAQVLDGYQSGEISDDGGVTYIFGYDEIQVSADATEMYGYTATEADYVGCCSTWYGAAVSYIVYLNGSPDLSGDAEDTSGTGYTESDIEPQMTQPNDQWYLVAQFGVINVVDCDSDCDMTTVAYDSEDLIVGSPTPVITSLLPTTWYANGEGQSVTIVGTGFGSAPTVQIADSSITISGLAYLEGDTITFTVTVPSNDANTSTQVTVTSTGYTPYGWSQGSPSNMANPTSSAQTVTITP